jgi:hypothetical protein
MFGRRVGWLVSLAAVVGCGGPGEVATQPATLVASPATPSVTIIATPRLTASPAATTTPSQSPATTMYPNGAAYLTAFVEWTTAKLAVPTLSTVQTRYVDQVKALQGATDPQLNGIYGLLGDGSLTTHFKQVAAIGQGVNGSQQETTVGPCLDLIEYMIYVNNAGYVGAIDLAFEVEATCERLLLKAHLGIDNGGGYTLREELRALTLP